MAPFTDDERRLVAELHAQGLGRNEITRKTKIAAKRVSAIAAELGLTFNRAGQVAIATAVRKADAAARRAAIQLDALEGAQRLYQQMFAPAHAFNFGGRDNTLAETLLQQPTFQDQRNIAVAMQALVTTAIRLAEFDKGTAGADGARSLLTNLGSALGVAAEALEQADQP